MIPALLGVGALLAKVATVSAICKAVTALKSALVSPPSPEVSSPEPDSHVKYTFDHLGSIRELVDASGVVQAAYRYSTYGERSKTSGNLDSDWGYAGLWHHAPSGLDLATYRVYDSATKRWISRDPLGEGTDRTLYSYCFNSPVNFSDPAGLDGLPSGWTMSSSGGVNSYSNNDPSNGPHYTEPPSPGPSGSPGSQISGSNGITGGRPGPVGGSGHVRPGSGGTWWDNSVLNTDRDGNAASAGDVYTGAEKSAQGTLMAGMILLPGTKISDVLKTRRGSIRQAPLPPGCPGWDRLSTMTWGEVQALNLPKKVLSTLGKLLTDGRFAK